MIHTKLSQFDFHLTSVDILTMHLRLTRVNITTLVTVTYPYLAAACCGDYGGTFFQ